MCFYANVISVMRMSERIIITVKKELLTKLNSSADAMNVSRNMLINQICRKHFGLENMLQEAS